MSVAPLPDTGTKGCWEVRHLEVLKLCKGDVHPVCVLGVLKHNTFLVLAEEQIKWHTESQTLTLSLFLKFYNFIFRATD